MKILDLGNGTVDDTKIFSDVNNVLNEGGIIVYPTDTIYGLGVNAFNEAAVLKVFKIKKRDKGKPISVLVRDLEMLRKVACVDSKAEKIIKADWPYPITFIMRKKDKISYLLTSGEEKIGVRVVNTGFVGKIFKNIDFPLTATSANISGEENLLKFSDIVERFKNEDFKPDILLNGGDMLDKKPSVIIDISDINNPKLVRSGVMSFKDFNFIFKKIINQ